MLDADTFRRLVLRHTGLIYVIHMDYGFRGEDLRDAVQEFWARLWANRERWPTGGPDNEVAFLRRQARCRADDRKRDDRALKRGGDFKAVPLEQVSAVRRSVALRFLRDDDDVIDAALIDHAIRVVASTLSIESEAVIVARLDEQDISFSKVATQRAIRGFRRAIELPIDAPQGAGIEDMGEHVVAAARRVAAEAAKHPDDIDLSEEVTCATEAWASSPATASPMSDEPRRSGARAAPLTPSTSSLVEPPTTPTWRACERRPSLRSPRRPSASARSRRLDLSASTTGTTPRPVRGAIPRTERTVVSRSPAAMFEEDSSVSGSRG